MGKGWWGSDSYTTDGAKFFLTNNERGSLEWVQKRI